MNNVYCLMGRQETVDKVLKCNACKDVCSYIYPATMSPNLIQCDYCRATGYMTDKIPRSTKF